MLSVENNMKNLRQYVRQFLLTEASAGIDPKIKRMLDELEENHGVINIENYPNQGQLVEIRFYAGADWNTRYYNTGVGGGADAGAAFAMYPGEKASGPNLITKLGNCNGAKTIGGLDGSIEVEYGFGPLLYDVLFDAVVMLGGATGLTCDYWSVSDDAYNVWNYYLNNRPDIIAKQKDLTQYPRTSDVSDDCTGPGVDGSHGYRSVAKRFGFKKAYAPNKFIPFDGENPGGQLSQEFIEHWFDPKNPLSKTYHRKAGGTPVIDYLRANFLLGNKGAKTIGQPYSSKELKILWDRTFGHQDRGNVKYLRKKAKDWEKKYGANPDELLS